MPRRRRAAHPSREPFERVLGRVEDAKRDLLDAVPSPRGVPSRPLAEALLAFEAGVRDALDDMPSWRGPDLELPWTRCEHALREALAGAERLRTEAPPLDYESLVAVLADLIGPLEAFDDADRATRFDRRRSSRRYVRRRWPPSSSGTS